jgi:hypothetical protein
VSLPDLVGVGLLQPGEELMWHRPRLNQTYRCVVTPDARLRVEDGRVFTTPSGAAMAVAEVVAYDGWHAWRIPARDGMQLDELREQFIALDASGSAPIRSEATQLDADDLAHAGDSGPYQ